MSTLQKLMDGAEIFAREWYKRYPQDQFTAVYIATDAHGALSFYETPWRNEREKLAMLAAIHREFARHQIIAYAMLSETWVSPSLNERIKRLGRAIDERPSEQPDREERFTIMATDGTSQQIAAFTIERDSGGAVRNLAREEKDPTLEIKGRMVGLLA